MKKLKVAIYSGVIPATTFIENLVKAVALNNIEVFIFGEQRSAIHYNSPEIHVYKSYKLSWKNALIIQIQIILLRIKHKNRYDLIKKHIGKDNPHQKQRIYLWSVYIPLMFNLPDIFHIQWAKTSEEWMFLKDLFNVKLIVSLRGAHINYKPLADDILANKYKHIFPKIDGFHAVSKQLAHEASLYGADLSKTKIIYSGIDIDFLQQISKPRSIQEHNPIKVISVGRMHWKKGYHFALDAFRKLADQGFNFHYTIIASLNAEEILYQIQDLQLENQVTLLKGMPQHKVFEQMINSDLLLLPSFEEGVANVVLEAMALRVPVLSSDYGGMAEVISHKQNGYLFHNRDKEDLISKLQYFFNESVEKKQQVAENGKSYVDKAHSLQRLGKEMSDFYFEIYNSPE